MTISEKMTAIKNILFENTPEQKFADYKTADNKIVRSEKLIVDAKIDEMFEDGTFQPLSTGEYQIPDEKITIKVEDGIIKEITEIVEEMPVVEEIKQEEVKPEVVEVKQVEEKVELTSEPVVIEEKIPIWFSDFKNEILAKFDSLNKEKEQLTAKVEKFAKSPAEGEVKSEKVGFISKFNSEKQSMEERNRELIRKIYSKK